jgi:hypothetical protein
MCRSADDRAGRGVRWADVVMHCARGAAAVAAAALIAVPLVACSGGTGRPGNGNAGPTSTSSAAPAAGSVLDCGSFIGTSTHPSPLQVVLGVVALPTSPGYPALQTSLSGDGNGPLRLFAKTGLVIRPGTTFELIVPARFTSQLSMGWGMPGTPGHRVLVDNCANAGGGWLAYAGGYWIDHPACVPVIVRAGGKQQQVHVGVGTACPGQRPPQGPSQS